MRFARTAVIAAAAGVVLASASLASAATFRIDAQPASGLPLNFAPAYDVTSEAGQVIQPQDLLAAAGQSAWFLKRNGKVKPVVGGILTSVTYTPLSGERFDGFSFKAKDEAPGQTIFVTVKPVGGAPETFSFQGSGDVGPTGQLGVVGNGRTAIQWVRVSTDGGFFKLKQEQFIPAAAVPEPASWALMVVGVGLIGFALRGMARAQRRLAELQPTA